MLIFEHMATVPQIIRRLLAASPALEEALHRDLLNISAYAREIQPIVERESRKRVNVAAISMAMRRLQNALPAPAKKRGTGKNDETRAAVYRLKNIQSEADMLWLSYSSHDREREAIEHVLPALSPASNIVRGLWSIDLFLSRDDAERVLAQRALRTPLAQVNDLALISLQLTDYVASPATGQAIWRDLDHHSVTVQYLGQNRGEVTVAIHQDDLVKAVGLLQRHVLHR